MSNKLPKSSYFFLLSIFLLTIGVKWWVVRSYGSEIPNWDQWDVEARVIYEPFANGTLTFDNFFQAHNEHRIITIRVQNFLLTLINGVWDIKVQMVLNQLIYGFCAVLVTFLLRRTIRTELHPWLYLAAIVCFSLPYSSENMLGGIHALQYYLIGASVLGMHLLLSYSPWTKKWFAGLGVAVFGLFTLGSGLFAPVAAAGIAGFETLRRPRSFKQWLPTAFAGLLLGVIGFKLLAHVPQHDALKAKNLDEILTAISYFLQWPFDSTNRLVAVLVQLPGLILVARYLLGNETERNRLRVLTCAVGWLYFQAIATAIARGGVGGEPASRYLDSIAAGLFINAAALLTHISDWGPGFIPLWRARIGKKCFALGASIWLIALPYYLSEYAKEEAFSKLPKHAKTLKRYEKSVKDFLKYNDPRELEIGKIPYPDPGALHQRLSHPYIRSLMPPVIRPESKYGPLSRIAQFLQRRVHGTMALGVVVFLLGVILHWRENRKILPRQGEAA